MANEALKNILDQLIHQSYSTQNFMVYVILDNCTDHSEELLADRLNIKVLNLNDGVTVGKDQAISILLEELRQNTTISSYVFLDVHRFIEEDFLLNVNRALKLSPVVSGQTIVIENDSLSFSEKVNITCAKYVNNFIRTARTLMGLSDRIDSSIFAINKQFVEKFDALDLKDINSELKYSILLSNLGYPQNLVIDLLNQSF